MAFIGALQRWQKGACGIVDAIPTDPECPLPDITRRVDKTAAAANASLDLLEADPSQFHGFEQRHRPHLQALASHPRVQRPRLIGTLAAFDLVVDGTAGYLNPAGPTVKRIAMNHGVFLRPLGQVVYLLPPLCISDAQLECCYEAITKALDQL